MQGRDGPRLHQGAGDPTMLLRKLNPTATWRICPGMEMWKNALGLVGAVLVVACGAVGSKSDSRLPRDQVAGVRHVDPAGAEKLIQEKRVVVLDIRTPAEFEAGHIAGAINLNFNDAEFSRKLDQLDKSRTYLVHCASGRRSTSSLETLRKLKFKSVVHLDGGLRAWEKAGNPVEK